jgi:histidinol-phosphate aminotransferase
MAKADFGAIVPECLKSLAPYVSGRLIEDVLEEMGLESAVKLASNENSLGPSPKALEAVAKALTGLNRYGDADSRRMRSAIAQKTGHPAEGVIAGNGSSEFVLVMAHALLGPGLRAVMSKPSFTLYAKNAQAAGAEVVELPLTPSHGHDLKAIKEAANGRTRLVFIDNPLNPTGAWLAPEELEDLAVSIPDSALLVLDEAYVDFARSPRPDYQALLAGGKVAVIRTFSKIYGLAGLRAAYALMAPELAQALNKARQPFNVNNLAQAAVLGALSDTEHLERTLSMTWSALDRLGRELPPLGLAPHPTEANFLMARLPGRLTADQLMGALLKEGVIIRSLSSFGLPSHIRINAGTDFELGVLLSALAKTLPSLA